MRSGGPRRDALDLVQYGLHYGRVVNNKDTEKSLNRVKVKLEWLDNGSADQTYWCQLVTPMGGNKFGWYNVPEIDDVVVIGFIQGDFSQPVVLGGVWSSTDAPPETNEDGKNNFRGYRSRSGHRLILDDSSKGKLVIADKTGNLMFGMGNFDKDGAGSNTCAVHKPPMSATSGISLSSKEGPVDVSCPSGKLSITAGDSVKFNIKTTIEVSASSDVTANGDSAMKLTAASPTNVDATTINYQ